MPDDAESLLLRGAAVCSRKCGMAKKIASAATPPRQPRSITACRQGNTMNRNAATAGSVIFPMSPAKL
jgi:hypothetical protein